MHRNWKYFERKIDNDKRVLAWSYRLLNGMLDAKCQGTTQSIQYVSKQEDKPVIHTFVAKYY